MSNFFHKKIKLGRKIISSESKCLIIAEAGVAHFGKIENAKRLVNLAHKANADFFKLQLFNAENLVSNYDENWQSRYKKRELNDNEVLFIDKYCKEKGLCPVYTFHDNSKLHLLNKLNPPFIKIGSGEIGNFEFINELIKFGKPIVISLGLHNENEIKKLISFFKRKNKKDVIFMHCTTVYPTKINQINLNKIDKLKKLTNAIVGYSDHSVTGMACVYSIFMGSKIIERHITLKKNIPDAQDWKVSSNQKEFITLVKQIKEAEEIYGKDNKNISLDQKLNSYWATKSLHASKKIKKGHIIKNEDIIIKRPNSGLEISKLKNIIGKKIKRNVEKDQPIKKNYV